MIRRIVQFVLCLSLPPLLVAQQASQDAVQPSAITLEPPQSETGPAVPPTIPADTKIKLVFLDEVSSATANVGSTVHLALAEDLVVKGVTVLRAVTPVNGTITKVRRAIQKRKDGALSIRVREIRAGQTLLIRLTSSDPEYRLKPLDYVGMPIVGAIYVAAYGLEMAFLPVSIPLLIDVVVSHFRQRGQGKVQEAVVPQCRVWSYWTAQPVILGPNELATQEPGSAHGIQSGCFASDGTGLGNRVKTSVNVGVDIR